MESTIKIGEKDVRLSNNFSWAIIYRDQFGHDIISTLMPMMAAAIDVASGLLSEASVDGKIDIVDVLKVLDGDKFLDAAIHLSGFEAVEFVNITWAMAKVLDEDIPEPKTWMKGFEEFPLDIIVPEVFKLALKGVVSSKNLSRLKDLASQLRVIQPSTSTQSSSPDSSED